ncbi:MAG: bifunctional (p)ppGpp synthetase/guanosine-3',5'-bis(diphosphate) 3'-pyrophosphohydrolase [Thiohalomonadales bacterium]
MAAPEYRDSNSVFLISDLCSILEKYLEHDQISEVYQAYLFGAEAHDGQHRVSGEPYIYHPLAAAKILAEMRMDHKSIIAAILHDVIEDTKTAKDEIAHLFGDEVADLVDGVSKLTNIHFESKAEAQAENFRKMMLAMVQDIRVILVKLADRMHNMRTLGALHPEKRRKIARETLEIYAPIAMRLGMNNMRLELEELGFVALYPMRCRILKESVRKAGGHRKEIITKIEITIQERLKQECIVADVVGRKKHLYSIYQKMYSKALSFNDVMDVFAFRIIVESVDICYRVLGVIHNLYKPVPGRFKDYIAIPKSNGYQSLHTVLFSSKGFSLEVQIRTEDMDKVANAGIAAHWLYKSGKEIGNSAQVRARQWLKNLLEMQQFAGNSMEFLENVKIDLFPDEVYVFTPNGDILELPRGATAIDFAYAVHTDVGNQCVAVKMDRVLMPLRTKLSNGQKIEIITATGANPNPVWLDFVNTVKARSNIRHYLKNLQKEESINLGKRLLDKCLRVYGESVNSLSSVITKNVLKQLNYTEMEQIYEEIGLGNQLAFVTARIIVGENSEQIITTDPTVSGKLNHPLFIKGTESSVVQFARCCRPIPGDSIIAFVSAGRGIVVHVQDCKNAQEFVDKPEKWIDIQWESEIDSSFPVEIKMMVKNQRGILATVAAAVAAQHANIENVIMDERDGIHSALSFLISVKNRKHLANVIRHVRRLKLVYRISRVRR